MIPVPFPASQVHNEHELALLAGDLRQDILDRAAKHGFFFQGQVTGQEDILIISVDAGDPFQELCQAIRRVHEDDRNGFVFIAGDEFLPQLRFPGREAGEDKTLN